MPEVTSTPWYFDAVLFIGAFSAMTWGFLVLFKPRTYRPDDDPEGPVEE